MSEDSKTSDKDDAKKRQRELVENLLAKKPVSGEGSAVVGGKRLGYTVTGQFLPVLAGSFAENAGEPQAAIFTLAYTLDDAASPRPVCFVFNGGPGSSSIWLHLGAV